LPHFNNDCFAHLKIFRRNLPFLQWSKLISLQSSVDIEKNQPPGLGTTLAQQKTTRGAEDKSAASKRFFRSYTSPAQKEDQ
jgi:hypothetical protein